MVGSTLPLVPTPRNLARAFIALTSLSAAGCFGDLDDPEEAADTDEPDCFVQGGICNGVEVYCDNDGNSPNYWWVPWSFGYCSHLAPITSKGCGANDPWCCLDDDLGEDTCMCRQYASPIAAHVSLDLEIGPLCVGESMPEGIDPIDDWLTGGYPEFDAEIRGWCSLACDDRSYDPIGSHPDEKEPKCVNADWSGHRTHPSWQPSDDFNCLIMAELNKDDPDGSELSWPGSSPDPATCDLNTTCADWFYPSAAAFLYPAVGSAAIIEPETRSAHYLGVNSGTSQLAIDMPGSGAGVDDTEDVFGLAEYTALDCDDDLCPFLLANLSAHNTADAWEITVETPGGPAARSFSNLQVDLVQSTLGLRNMALDKVAFAPGALRLLVQFSVAGMGVGAGTHAYVVENNEKVIADYDAGSLSLAVPFRIQDGEGTLTVEVDPDEHPPVASHDLDATEACDWVTGIELDPHLTASDPDNDIEVVIWWVDGEPCSDDCWVPLGTHDVVLEVHDARDARVVSDVHAVTVTNGPSCAVGP